MTLLSVGYPGWTRKCILCWGDLLKVETLVVSWHDNLEKWLVQDATLGSLSRGLMGE